MKNSLFFFLLLVVTLPACSEEFADSKLIDAIQDDHALVAKFWLEHGADANCMAKDGPVLLLAMEKDWERHYNRVKFINSVELTELLLQYGADPNSKKSILPLTYAVEMADYRMCHILLQYGANPKITETYQAIYRNSIEYAKQLGYLRIAELLTNPQKYSPEYTVLELNFLVNVSFNNKQFDEVIKYSLQYYRQYPLEMASDSLCGLTMAHIYYTHASALFQKSADAIESNKFLEAEDLLLKAIEYDKKRKQLGDTRDLGVDLNDLLISLRGLRVENPASVLDELAFLMREGRKDTTTIFYLMNAGLYLGTIADFEGKYECYKTAYEWVREDINLRNNLSDGLYFRVISGATGNYSATNGAIVTEQDISRDMVEMRSRFGVSSKYYLMYEMSVADAYTYYFKRYDDAEALTLDVIRNVERKMPNISTIDDDLMDLYMLANYQLAGLYDYCMQQPIKAYSVIKGLITNALYKPYIRAGIYESWISLCYDLKRFDDIWFTIPDYYKLKHEEIENAMFALSEEDLLYWYGSYLPFYWDDIIVLATKQANNVPDQLVGELYNHELFKKGLMLRSMEQTRRFLSQSSDHAIRHLYELVLQQKTELLALNSATEKDYEQLATLNDQINSNERLLVAESRTYHEYKSESTVDWKSVKQSLKAGEVVIEFINHGMVDQYFALVLRREWDAPKLIQLPEMILYPKEIQDSKMKSYEDYAEKLGFYDLEPHFLKVNGDAGEVYEYGGNGTDLYNAIWKPLLPYVKRGECIYFAPSGALMQLAIEALPISPDLRLMDEYRLVRLSSTREVALTKNHKQQKNAILYGGITYSIDDMSVFEQESKKYLSVYGEATRTDDYSNGKPYAPLKYLAGTQQEVDKIAKLLKKNKYSVTSLTRTAANEESLKDQSGHSSAIIHLATHGFYWDNLRATGEPFIQQSPNADQYIDPLTRCGLYMSGADMARSGSVRKLPAGSQDGVLTAKEISLLDLTNTNLVVLSACQTGQGEISPDGVFGLQRAFKQAGVQTIVMSLWEVSDSATQELMSLFYSYLMAGQTKREAFYNAQKAIRKSHPEPYYWAGFIMLD